MAPKANGFRHKTGFWGTRPGGPGEAMAELGSPEGPTKGLRPHTTPTFTETLQLYGTVPTFPSWARMKKEEKTPAARPRLGAAKCRPRPDPFLRSGC